MFVLWLVLFVIGGTGLACRLMAVSRRPAPPQPLRLLQAGHVRVWPAWWDQLDEWRDELGDGAA
jgi:hypothetical protein